MHINADPLDQVNPCTTLVIVTRGQARSRIGGVERILREGEAVLVPAGTAHEVWAGPGDYAECLLVMLGAGA
jgi:quercetin dioxygenase-like cupin family protein